MTKNSDKKVAKWMIVVSLIICVAAVFVALLAVNMKQYIVAAAMFAVAFCQIYNCKQWKKKK